jgi:hypothetical protein
VKTSIALTIAASLVFAAGCGHGGRAVAPAGWTAIPGETTAWTNGSGTSAQEYRFSQHPFGGTMQDLASSVTIDVLLHHHGARLKGSVVPFAPCPGSAAVATFTLPSGELLEEGFGMRSTSESVRTSYRRPADASDDPAVLDAMRQALCLVPG